MALTTRLPGTPLHTSQKAKWNLAVVLMALWPLLVVRPPPILTLEETKDRHNLDICGHHFMCWCWQRTTTESLRNRNWNRNMKSDEPSEEVACGGCHLHSAPRVPRNLYRLCNGQQWHIKYNCEARDKNKNYLHRLLSIMCLFSVMQGMEGLRTDEGGILVQQHITNQRTLTILLNRQ